MRISGSHGEHEFHQDLGIHRERNIVGASLFDLNLRIFSDPSIRRNIERIQQSGTYLTEMQHIEDSTNHIYLLEFAPTVSHARKARDHGQPAGYHGMEER